MSEEQDEGFLGAKREEMVREHLAARGVTDGRVLAAFRRVPRELFVPESERARAYADWPLAIGYGQTISQPYMAGLMTQQLQVLRDQRVLEVGTGSGYQTAILADLGAEVYTIERIAELSEAARERLARLGYGRVHCRTGDGTLGWPEEAPFDRIMVTAGAPRTPPPLAEQLADGGRMVIPVGGERHQELMLVERRGERVEERFVCGCIFVKLIGRQGWSGAE